MSGPIVPQSYRALINSARVSTGTRQALNAREFADDLAYRPAALSVPELASLRAVIARVLPQQDDAAIDLARLLDAQLHTAQGDGWRFAELPDDRTAYVLGLSVLEKAARDTHGTGFTDLTDSLQDDLLAKIESGDLPRSTQDTLDVDQMRLWFQDVRGDAVKLYMAHPATLARIGYSGIGYGGDGADKAGFSLIGLGEREGWEPMPQTESESP
jgi:hypothetical protein